MPSFIQINAHTPIASQHGHIIIIIIMGMCCNRGRVAGILIETPGEGHATHSVALPAMRGGPIPLFPPMFSASPQGLWLHSHQKWATCFPVWASSRGLTRVQGHPKARAGLFSYLPSQLLDLPVGPTKNGEEVFSSWPQAGLAHYPSPAPLAPKNLAPDHNL